MTETADAPEPAAAGHALNFELGYLILRVFLGIAFFMRGLTRIIWGMGGLLGYFKAGTEGKLPELPVVAYAYVLTGAELVLGLMLLLGLKTRWALLGLGVVMATLVLGACIVAKWPAAHAQLLHTMGIVFLLYRLQDNRFSVDRCVLGQKP